MFVCSFADNLHCRLGQPIDFGCLQSHGASSFHGGHHGIKNTANNEDLFFGDAEQIIVVCATLDDASSSEVEVGCFVDNHGRIARSGHNGSLATVEGCSCDRGSASDANQRDTSVLEQLLSGLKRRFTDERYQVVDT